MTFFMNDTISRSNCDLFMTFSALYDLFVNEKMILSRSNYDLYDLFMNETI